MPRKAYYYLALTPHQRAALLTVISGYMTHDPPVEVSIDAASGEEIPIGELLTLVMDAQPTVVEEGGES